MAKSKMSLGKLIMTIAALALVVAAIVPLFMDVWTTVYSAGSETEVALYEGGTYFADYSLVADAFKYAETFFVSWASMIAGIALIVAVCGGVLYAVGSIMGMVSNAKISNKLAKIGSIVMLIAGIVVAVASLLFVIPAITETVGSYTISTSLGLGFGAILGIIAPIGAGVLGMMTSKK